jgi:hypothetical protein
MKVMKTRAQFTVVVAIVSALAVPMFAADPVVSDEWKAMKFPDLVGLASSLYVQGDQAKAQRLGLIELITSKYVADAEAMRSGSIGGWRLLALTLSSDLSGQAKAKWVQKLRESFVDDTKSLAAMTDSGLAQLVDALNRLGVRDTSGVRVAHISVTVDFSKMKSGYLPRFSDSLRSLGKSGVELRGKFLGYLRSPGANESSAIGSLTSQQWSVLFKNLHTEMSARDKAAWTARLRAKYTYSPKAVAAMKYSDLQSLVQLLGRLGDKQASKLNLNYAMHAATLDSCDAGVLIRFSNDLARMGKPAKAARVRLIGHINDRYMSKTVSIASLTTRQWRELINPLSKDMSKDLKAVWADKLRGVFVQDADRFRAMSHIGDLLTAFGQLGRKDNSDIVAAHLTVRTDFESLKPADIPGLAQQVGRLGKAGVSFRAKLIGRISAKHLSSPAAVKALTIAQWRGSVSALIKDLSPTIKAQWRGKLRSAFIGDEEDLFALGAKVRPSDRSRRIDDLASLLGQLGDKDVGRLKMAVDIAALPDFTTLSGDGLAACASRIERLGPPAAKVRVGFIAHIRKKHLATDEAAKTLTLTQWRSIAAMMRQGVEGRTREQFVIRLRSAFAGAPEAVGRLRKGELGVLIGILQALGDKEARDLEITHIEANGTWKILQAEELASLVGKFGASGASLRTRIIEYIESKYLSTDDGPKALTAIEWSRLTSVLAGDLSSEQRGRWISKITPVFLSENMRSSSLSSIRGALNALGDQDTSVFVSKWTGKHDSWKSWKPERLVGLVSRSGRGPETEAWRGLCKSLVPHINEKYFADTATVRDAGIRNISILVNSLGAGLPGETRFKWAAKIRSTFVPNKKAIFARKLSGLREIIDVLTRLGDQTAPELNVAWMAGNTEWRSEKLSDLTRFTRGCLLGKGGELAIGRKKVGRFISENKLNSSQNLANAGIECVRDLVVALVGDLGDDVRPIWAKNIQTAFAADEQAIKNMDVRRFTSLSQTIALLDKKAGAAMTATRLSASKSWSDASLETLLARMKSMASAKDKQNSKLLARLDATLVDRNLDWETCRTVSRAYSSVSDHRHAQTWTKRMYEAILGSKKSRDESGLMSLYCLADDLYDRGLTGRGIGYNEYAAEVAERARQGSLGGAKPGTGGKQLLIACHGLDFLWGKPLQSEEAQQIVRRALIDAEGVPRVKVGKILGWAYRSRSSEFNAWRQYVDGELAKSGLGTDARAAWLMVKAHTEAIRFAPVNPGRGTAWLKQAVIAAKSEPLRLAVVDELMAYFEQDKHPQAAARIIESIAHQFSAEAQVRLGKITQRAERARLNKQAQAAASRARHELVGRKGLARHFQTKLAQAEKRNDRKAIEQLKTAITKLHE